MRLASSFRDPHGFVFRDDGVVLRHVATSHREHFDQLIASGLYERLTGELTESGELPDVLAALEEGDDERALELLVEAVVAAQGDGRERLLQLTVGLFGELGDEHPLTMRYRRRLAASLY